MTYPEMISNLPEADIPFKGVKGRYHLKSNL